MFVFGNCIYCNVSVHLQAIGMYVCFFLKFNTNSKFEKTNHTSILASELRTGPKRSQSINLNLLLAHCYFNFSLE